AVKYTQSPATLAQIAAAYALAGRKDRARAMIPGIEGQARQRYVCGFNVACLYSALGEKERAFAWLARAYRDRSDGMPPLGVDPRLEPVRGDPRFADLLHKMGLTT